MQKITIIGHAAAAPLKPAPELYPNFITFSVGATSSVKDKAGNYEKITDWYKVSFSNQYTSNMIFKELKKGDKVYVEGKPSLEQYTSKIGEKKVAFKIAATNVVLMKKPNSDSENSYNNEANINTATDNQLDDEIPF